MYGAEPDEMFSGASSSKTVSTKFLPELSGPSGCSASLTVVEVEPSLWVTWIDRSPTQPCVMREMLTSTSLITPEPPIVSVELTPALLSSGMALGTSLEDCGDAAPG